MKTIPFDLETAKKIHSGKIKGNVTTVRGEKVRILAFDLDHITYKIVAEVQNMACPHMSNVRTYTEDGVFYNGKCDSEPNLVLHVPDQFALNPKDMVLIEYKVGETFQFGKKKLKCVEAYCCNGCVFSSFGSKECNYLSQNFTCACNSIKRFDGKGVIFIQADEDYG